MQYVLNILVLNNFWILNSKFYLLDDWYIRSLIFWNFFGFVFWQKNRNLKEKRVFLFSMLFKDCQNFSYLGVDVAVQLSILLNNCRCFSLWCSSLTIAIFPHQINALPWQLLKMGGKRLEMKRKWEMFCPNKWYTSDAKEKLPKYHSIKVLFNTKGSRNMEQQRATGVSNVAGHYHEREQYFIWDSD